MKKNRFDEVCERVGSGVSTCVSHPSTNEEGRILRCSLEHFVVETEVNKRQCWDFHDCEEII